MFNQNQAWIDSTIGSSAYDIGHVFGTGSGGLASLGSACDRDFKAHGVSGISPPINDPFWIDFVAHEIGHQLNADHSFNGSSASCISGRNQATAFEPGSGSTIMAYAGICGVENLQVFSDATFHAASIAQVDSFTKSEVAAFVDRLKNDYVAPDWYADLDRQERLSLFKKVTPNQLLGRNESEPPGPDRERLRPPTERYGWKRHSGRHRAPLQRQLPPLRAEWKTDP